ncbi:MAG: hypothetical protein U5K38_11625 [Woeseiaceae bacterium]|nr:hypothetical protein [Woeseiaceae bacterium]
MNAIVDAYDAPMVVRRNHHVLAADEHPDQAAATEQQHRRDQRRAQRTASRTRSRRGEPDGNRQCDRQYRDAASQTHGPGMQVAMLDRRDLMGEIRVWRYEDACQGQRKHQQRDARAQRQARAGGAGQPQPRYEHQERPCELQGMPAAPEQDLEIRFADEPVRHDGKRPAESQQGDRRGDNARVETELQRAAAVWSHPDFRCSHQAPQHQQDGTGAEYQ